MIALLKGLSLQGYIIGALAMLFLTMSAAVWWKDRQNNNLREDLAGAKVEVSILNDALILNYEALDKIEGELRECATKRAEAAEKALESEARINRALRQSFLDNQELRDEIRKEVEKTFDNANCSGATFSPRASELLIEAARRANRGAGGS